MILRIIGAALIAVSSFSAAAVVINANDFAIGADFSNPDSNITPTRQFSIKAVEYSSDGVLAFAFDKNGNYIPNPYKTVSSLDWRVAEPYFGHAYDRTITYYFDTDVYSILFGGEDTETYIYEINTSLPEPGTIVLMFVGFLGLMVRARAKRQLRSN